MMTEFAPRSYLFSISNDGMQVHFPSSTMRAVAESFFQLGIDPTFQLSCRPNIPEHYQMEMLFSVTQLATSSNGWACDKAIVDCALAFSIGRGGQLVNVTPDDAAEFAETLRFLDINVRYAIVAHSNPRSDRAMRALVTISPRYVYLRTPSPSSASPAPASAHMIRAMAGQGRPAVPMFMAHFYPEEFSNTTTTMYALLDSGSTHDMATGAYVDQIGATAGCAVHIVVHKPKTFSTANGAFTATRTAWLMFDVPAGPVKDQPHLVNKNLGRDLQVEPTPFIIHEEGLGYDIIIGHTTAVATGLAILAFDPDKLALAVSLSVGHSKDPRLSILPPGLAAAQNFSTRSVPRPRPPPDDVLPFLDTNFRQASVDRPPTDAEIEDEGCEFWKVFDRPGDFTDQPLFSMPNIVTGANGVNAAQAKVLHDLVMEFHMCFSETLGRLPADVPYIDLQLKEGHSLPRTAKARRLLPAKQKFVVDHLDTLVALGIYSPSTFDFASPVVIVPKARPPDALPSDEDTYRLCGDYTALNLEIVHCVYPLPNIADHLLKLAGARFKVNTDMVGSYNQIGLTDLAQDYATIITLHGLFKPRRGMMGLQPVGGLFQHLMNDVVFKGLIGKIVFGYVDDFTVPSGPAATDDLAFLELVKRFRSFLERVALHRILLKPSKTFIGIREGICLGHLVSAEGLSLTAQRKQALTEYPMPYGSSGQQMKQTTRFLGMCGYVRNHFENYASVIAPLTKFAGSATPVTWEDEHTKAFLAMRQLALDAPMLRFLDPARPAYLRTDASAIGVGAVLLQKFDNREYAICFWSRRFTDVEARWPTGEQEGFAYFWGIISAEYHFSNRVKDLNVVETDHNNLLYIGSSHSPKLRRWHLRLFGIPFVVKHRPGKWNVMADAFSRCFSIAESPISLPSPPSSRLKECYQQFESRISLPDSVMQGHIHAITRQSVPALLPATATVPALPSIPRRGNPRTPANRRPVPPSERAVLDLAATASSVGALATTRSAIPKAHVNIFSSVHNSLLGHHGVKKTCDSLRLLGCSWPTMVEDVGTLVRGCAVCQKLRKTENSEADPVSDTRVSRPFEVLCIDFIGPLPPDADGNGYIHLSICGFTRWKEVDACKAPTAKEAARCLLRIFCRYGAIKYVRSDQGSHYTAQTTTEFLQLLGVTPDFTIAYRPQANGIVERANGEAMRHLKALVMENVDLKSTWSTYLPLVARLLNATVCSSTGFSPAQMLYGDMCDLNRGLVTGFSDVKVGVEGFKPCEYVAQLQVEQQRLIQAAARYQVEVLDRRLARGASDVIRVFEVGMFVVVSHPNRPPTKLSPPWFGPLQIIEIAGSNSYRCRDLVSGKIRHLHAARLKVFNASSCPWPVRVAAADVGEFAVLDIVDHRVSETVGLEFRVRWDGHPDPDDDTWKPFAEANELLALDAYLLLHPELEL
jgi:hypothetical protein